MYTSWFLLICVVLFSQLVLHVKYGLRFILWQCIPKPLSLHLTGFLTFWLFVLMKCCLRSFVNDPMLFVLSKIVAAAAVEIVSLRWSLSVCYCNQYKHGSYLRFVQTSTKVQDIYSISPWSILMTSLGRIVCTLKMKHTNKDII